MMVATMSATLTSRPADALVLLSRIGWVAIGASAASWRSRLVLTRMNPSSWGPQKAHHSALVFRMPDGCQRSPLGDS